MKAEQTLSWWNRISPMVEQLDEHTQDIIAARTEGVIEGRKLALRELKKQVEVNGAKELKGGEKVEKRRRKNLS